MQSITLNALATVISRVDFVPPLDLWFTKFPTEIHHAPIQHAWEVAKAAIQFLNDNAHFLNSLQVFVDLLESLNIVWPRHTATAEGGIGTSLADFVFCLDQEGLSSPDS